MPNRELTSGRAAVDRVPSPGSRAQAMIGRAPLGNEASLPAHSSHGAWRWEGVEGCRATMETQCLVLPWVPGVSSGVIHVSANTVTATPPSGREI